MKKSISNFGATLNKEEQKTITGGLSDCSSDDLKCQACEANGGLWITGDFGHCGFCVCPDHLNQQ